MPYRYLLFSLSLLWLGHHTVAMAALPVAPFEAHYTVYGKGIPLGEGVMTLTDGGNGQYDMRSEVRPYAPLALLVAVQINERASGEFRDGVIRPLDYKQQSSGSKSSTTEISFDWQHSTLRAQHNAQQAIIPLTAGIVDPLSLHLQVMWDLQEGHKPTQYTLVDGTELKTYQIKLEGEETLKTPLGNLDTVRISQSKPGSTRITTFWFAPALSYLTVQIAQEKDSKETLRMVIKSVQGRNGK